MEALSKAEFERKYLVSEGEIARAKQDVMALVNDIVTRISRVAEASGFRTDPIFVHDIRSAFRPGRIEIQAGRNELFEGSQIVDITVYDDDDLSVTIPTGVSEKFNVPINNTFRSVDSVIAFVQKFAELIKSKEKPEIEPSV